MFFQIMKLFFAAKDSVDNAGLVGPSIVIEKPIIINKSRLHT